MKKLTQMLVALATLAVALPLLASDEPPAQSAEAGSKEKPAATAVAKGEETREEQLARQQEILKKNAKRSKGMPKNRREAEEGPK